MMTGVSAGMAVRRDRFWIGVGQRAVALLAVAAGIFTLWYRHTYNVWPGQDASARVHWCGRDYESFSGPAQIRQQISSREHFSIHPVGQYPPLGSPARNCSPRSSSARSGHRSARRHCAPWWSTCPPARIGIGSTPLRAARDALTATVTATPPHTGPTRLTTAPRTAES